MSSESQPSMFDVRVVEVNSSYTVEVPMQYYRDFEKDVMTSLTHLTGSAITSSILSAEIVSHK